MTAQEAFKQATDIRVGRINDQYMNCLKSIEQAVKKCELQSYVYESLYPEVKKQLEQDGFIVTSDFGRNEYTITISWKHIGE